MKRRNDIVLYAIIGTFSALTLLPFLFVINNSFRTNTEIFHSFFGTPDAFKEIAAVAGPALRDVQETLAVVSDEGETMQLTPREAAAYHWGTATKGYRLGWEILRRFMLNTLFVCGITAIGVVILGSISAYVLSRYRFFGSRFVFYFIISTLMFPGVLTLIPSFLVVKKLGLLDTYWVLILPYIAGGQVFATFVFKSFFDGLPEDLFESARIDGANHLAMYWHIVLPLSKPVISVVMIMSVLGTWNNFLWPFITISNTSLHVIASGLFVMAKSTYGQNLSTLFAAYVVASIPLLILFAYATKPFIQGVTSGAFKA
jgi:ABC-type glycerol-3-phosphate transport system permease component